MTEVDFCVECGDTLSCTCSSHDSIDSRFRTFHRENPHVYQILVRLAREARTRGKTRLGVKALWERMRWDIWMQTEDDDEFKLNNNFTSRYARLIVRQEPDIAGMFELRALRS